MHARLPAAFARISAGLSLLALAGCAPLERAADHTRDFANRYPVVTAVGVAVVVGGAVAAIEAGHHRSEPIPLRPQLRTEMMFPR